MKRMVILLLTVFSVNRISAQPGERIRADLRDLNGALVDFNQVIGPDSPTLVVFWKSGSTRCCDNLETLETVWLRSLKTRNVRLIAICEDCNGRWSRVKPEVEGREWEFEVFIDVNGDLKRALGINTLPTTQVYDSGHNLLCSHPGWCSGNEELVCKNILELLVGKDRE